MLMTVLRGEIATRQSIAIIRTFKSMKDYIIDSGNSLSVGDVLQLSNQVNDNSNEIKKLKNKNKYIQSQLKVVMDNFKDPTKYKPYILFNNKRIEADEVYRDIYSTATKSVVLVDNYISIKTLTHLKHCNKGVDIIIYSDNTANKLERIDIDKDINDFKLDTGLNIDIRPTNNKIHDRFIFIDYDTDNEKLYLCGPSSKDAGSKISIIMEVEYSSPFHLVVDELNK